MIRVERKGKDSIEKILRKFKRKVEDAGIIAEIKGRTYFEKPSDIQRRKKRKSIKRAKEARKESQENMSF